ncbi:MAG: response regulator [Nitrososphaera sp.]|uniref:response regulator n=1 Tax=Nitrososphaera sp. TaxID=1971748 RepID=UPI003D6F947D
MKVLVIDDNADIIEAVSICLDDAGVEYKTIDNGRDGLDEIKARHYDLIVLDLAIPEFSGYDIIKALKDDGILESKNIVISTASSIVESDRNDLLALGAKDVLPKPYRRKDLMSVIARFNPASK